MMKFTVTAFVFLICTAALLSTTEGIPRMSRRCQCIQTYSNPPIDTARILSLKVIPAGSHCKNEEIIATRKKEPLCLNPRVDWVISLKKEMCKGNIKSQMTRRPSGGERQRLFTQQQELAVVDLVRADNAIRLHQLRQKILADRQVFNNINHVSIITIRRILGKHNITMKQLYRVPFERNSVRVKGL
ncbi:unnamed protein product [Leuciscus chuanchicus]